MGYDETRFVNPPGDEFKCPICTDVLKNPVECGECQSSFCQECIDEWRKNKELCPSRCQLKLQPCHRQFKNIYLRLSLRCSNSVRGCDAVLSVENIERHEATDCEYREARCRHEGCPLVDSAKVVKTHEEQCEYAKLTCGSCEFTLLRRDKDAHSCLSTLLTAIQSISDANKTLEESIVRLEEEAKASMDVGAQASNYQVHLNTECAGCHVQPIAGKRFMCLKCVDCSVCEQCREEFKHPHAEFVEMSSSENHEGVRCDGCGEQPVRGLRYKCKQCPDFDFCHKCRLTQRHPHPDFTVWQPFWISVVPLPEEQKNYQQGERFTRAWLIVNLGTEAIPQVLLNCVGGEPCCERTSLMFDHRLPQNASMILSVSQPVQGVPPGDYASEWSLSTSERCSFFGPKLTYRLSVI